MTSSQDRIENAFAALIADERSLGGKDTALDMSRRLFGDLDETFIQCLVLGVEGFAREVFASLEDEAVAAYLIFLAGVRLGKQLGIAEGSELPNLEALYEG